MGPIHRLRENRPPTSLTHQLRSLTILACTISVLFALLIHAVINLIDFRNKMQSDLILLSEVTAFNSIAALSFADQPAAQAVLTSLKNYPGIQFAALYTPDGHMFEELGEAEFKPDIPKDKSKPKAKYFNGMLQSIHPVMYQNNWLGTLVIIINTDAQYDQILNTLGVGILIIMLSGIIIIFLSSFLSRPLILALKQIIGTIEELTQNKNLEERAKMTDIVEFNTLVQGFNSLVEEIAFREKQLKLSRKRLSLALEGSGEGSWDWDMQDGTVFFDKRAHEILAYPDGSIGNLLQDWEALIHPNDLKSTQIALKEHLVGNRSEYQAEHRVLTASEKYIWVSIHGKTVESTADNKPLRLTGTILDISDRHNAEEESQILSAIFKNSKEPVAVFDKELYLQAVNTAFVELTSCKDEYLVGSNLMRLFLKHNDGEYFSNIRDSLQEHNSWEGEIRCGQDLGEESFVRWLNITSIASSNNGADATYLGSFSDIEKREGFENELRYLANYDSLTSLPNRRLLTDRMRHTLALSKRHDRSFAIIFVDLDRFKIINDTLGHAAGDELLIQVSERLQSQIRSSDTLARLGGDEFVLLIEEINSRETIAKISQNIIGQFSQAFHIENQEFTTSSSIGISVYPDDGDDIGTLMKNADTAMYAAKDNGRNNYHFYRKEMNERAREKLALENDLHKAIANNEFFLVYQPKVCIKTGELIGAEVLIRWQHPIVGLIAPDQFISLAEETGLIIPIGRWVLQTACEKIIAWEKLGYASAKLAVNVSVKQFSSAEFMSEVKRILSVTGVSPELLELELTESLLMDTADSAIDTLCELKTLGFGLSIDDFGTGYSSLQYLSKFPIDLLKIDRSFISGLNESVKSVAIVRAIIAMAKGLGLKVIAEGIEDDAQARLLLEFECDYAQGYFYSRPLSEEDYLEYLQERSPAFIPTATLTSLPAMSSSNTLQQKPKADWI